MNEEKKAIYRQDLGVAKAENFSSVYPVINSDMLERLSIQDSRNGEVREMLDFKTILTDPYKRCVGGYKRNINIFFLLAEAIWITVGRKDVAFLDLFNKNMKNYSDNGAVFHAPYGFRLRHWGIRAEDEYTNGNLDAKGRDQVIENIKLMTDNPNSRQIVFQIWNPDLDLGVVSKDLPCNDTLMVKIRDGKLHSTIQNRSNDLHWGLPTNVFQFSFLTEVIASCLGYELGTQVHNSQSLHIYASNLTADVMKKEWEQNPDACNLYDIASERKMDFDFLASAPYNRFKEVEYHFNVIINNLFRVSRNEEPIASEIDALKLFSKYFHVIYKILENNLFYQKVLKELKGANDRDILRWNKAVEVQKLCSEIDSKEANYWDVSLLAMNFYYARMEDHDDSRGALGTF